MAKFKVTAEIYVEGSLVCKEHDAIGYLAVLLGCFDDMDDTDTFITINPIKTERQ